MKGDRKKEEEKNEKGEGRGNWVMPTPTKMCETVTAPCACDNKVIDGNNEQ